MENENEVITCTVRKKIIEYWIAETTDGKEVQIRGMEEEKLVDGMQISGILDSDEVQDRYDDGSYARSFSIEEWLQVSNK